MASRNTLTSKPIISSESLSNLIDQCVSELHNGQGNKLFELAGVLNSIAECNVAPYLFIFPQGVGAFSTELIRSNSLITIPVLPEKVRESHGKLVSVATEQAIKALEIIKNQLCKDDAIDYEKLMGSVGIFFQQASVLSNERRQFSRSTPSQKEE